MRGVGGHKPHYRSGDFLRVCDVCGSVYYASETRKRWDGLIVCEEDFETRHPQDFVRGVADRQRVPDPRPESSDTFVADIDGYTKLILHMDGSDASTTFSDDSPQPKTFTANGNAQIDTAAAKFGTASGLFDGTGDFVSTPDHANFTLGSGDFTVDLWFNCNASSGTSQRMVGHGTDAGTPASYAWDILRSTGNVMQARVSNGTAFTTITGTTQFTSATNTGWHHLAFIRVGNILKMFIDGEQEGDSTTFMDGVADCPNVLTVGTNVPSGAGDGTDWKGWIDEFRLSVGIARWVADFTPPIAAYAGPVSGDDL